MGRPRKGAEPPSLGLTCPSRFQRGTPEDPSSNQRPVPSLHRPLTGRPLDYLATQSTEGPRPSSRPRTNYHPGPRKRDCCSGRSPGARKRELRPAPGGERNALRPRAPPSSAELTSTAWPAGPASATNSGLQPHLRKLLFSFSALGEGQCRVRRAGKQPRSAALGVSACRTGDFPQ